MKRKGGLAQHSHRSLFWLLPSTVSLSPVTQPTPDSPQPSHITNHHSRRKLGRNQSFLRLSLCSANIQETCHTVSRVRTNPGETKPAIAQPFEFQHQREANYRSPRTVSIIRCLLSTAAQVPGWAEPSCFKQQSLGTTVTPVSLIRKLRSSPQ